VYEKERSIIEKILKEELLLINTYIDEVESYSAITAPESPLGIILSKQKDSDIQLQRTYVRKRKIMNFMHRVVDDVQSFLCTNCGQIIELERLLVMSKASLCDTCASAA